MLSNQRRRRHELFLELWKFSVCVFNKPVIDKKDKWDCKYLSRVFFGLECGLSAIGTKGELVQIFIY